MFFSAKDEWPQGTATLPPLLHASFNNRAMYHPESHQKSAKRYCEDQNMEKENGKGKKKHVPVPESFTDIGKQQNWHMLQYVITKSRNKKCSFTGIFWWKEHSKTLLMGHSEVTAQTNLIDNRKWTFCSWQKKHTSIIFFKERENWANYNFFT